MQSLVICSANADAAATAEIRKYVETNCSSITVQEDISWESPNEMLEAVESALWADIVLLLASPHAIPAAWSRPQWESVLVEQPANERTALAFILLRACRLPEVLRKKNFFDLTADWHAGAYSLRRWLFDQNPLRQERCDSLPPDAQCSDASETVVTELERQICYHPGIADSVPRPVAAAFVRKHRFNFEGVVWLNCMGRGLTGVIGDTAHALGMKLTGPTERNTAALHKFCSGHRVLYVFDQLDAQHRGFMSFTGRASIVFTAISDAPACEPKIAELLELFNGAPTRAVA
jgi:hypothetical protein